MVVMALLAAPTLATLRTNASADPHLPQASIIVFELTDLLYSDKLPLM